MAVNWSKAGRSLHVGLALLCVLPAAGCIVVPVRTKTVIQNPAGHKEPFPQLAIVPGRTTREQVEEQYKSFAVDSGAPNLFWGRFRKSSWAVFVGVGGPPISGFAIRKLSTTSQLLSGSRKRPRSANISASTPHLVHCSRSCAGSSRWSNKRTSAVVSSTTFSL